MTYMFHDLSWVYLRKVQLAMLPSAGSSGTHIWTWRLKLLYHTLVGLNTTVHHYAINNPAQLRNFCLNDVQEITNIKYMDRLTDLQACF